MKTFSTSIQRKKRGKRTEYIARLTTTTRLSNVHQAALVPGEFIFETDKPFAARDSF